MFLRLSSNKLGAAGFFTQRSRRRAWDPLRRPSWLRRAVLRNGKGPKKDRVDVIPTRGLGLL
jgi:hypothetical protein